MDVFGQRQAPTTDGRMGLKDVHGGQRGCPVEAPFLFGMLSCMDRWKTTRCELSKLVSVPFPELFLMDGSYAKELNKFPEIFGYFNYIFSVRLDGKTKPSSPSRRCM